MRRNIICDNLTILIYLRWFKKTTFELQLRLTFENGLILQPFLNVSFEFKTLVFYGIDKKITFIFLWIDQKFYVSFIFEIEIKPIYAEKIIHFQLYYTIYPTFRSQLHFAKWDSFSKRGCLFGCALCMPQQPQTK